MVLVGPAWEVHILQYFGISVTFQTFEEWGLKWVKLAFATGHEKRILKCVSLLDGKYVQ